MKISIVGTGKTGTATAFALVARGLADDLLLVARDPTGVAAGHARDLLHASVFVSPRPPGTVSAGTVADAAGSDLIIVTSSVPLPPRQPGQAPDRMALAEGNYHLFRTLIPQLAQGSPGATFIIVTNPVDVMTHVAITVGNLPPGCVIGTGTLIDTGRFRALLTDLVAGHPNDVRAYVLGEHGRTMVPALTTATIAGMPLPFAEGTIQQRFDEARDAGNRVFQEKGYTDYAIAACVSMIVKAVEQDTHEVLPISTLIDGPYGIHDVCLSLPCIVGRRGVLRVLEPKLDENEVKALRHSAGVIRKTLDRLYAS